MLKLRIGWHGLRVRLVVATETSRTAAQGMVEYGILVALIAVAEASSCVEAEATVSTIWPTARSNPLVA